jgi:hypothetical protein
MVYKNAPSEKGESPKMRKYFLGKWSNPTNWFGEPMSRLARSTVSTAPPVVARCYSSSLPLQRPLLLTLRRCSTFWLHRLLLPVYVPSFATPSTVRDNKPHPCLLLPLHCLEWTSQALHGQRHGTDWVAASNLSSLHNASLHNMTYGRRFVCGRSNKLLMWLRPWIGKVHASFCRWWEVSEIEIAYGVLTCCKCMWCLLHAHIPLLQ